MLQVRAFDLSIDFENIRDWLIFLCDFWLQTNIAETSEDDTEHLWILETKEKICMTQRSYLKNCDARVF